MLHGCARRRFIVARGTEFEKEVEFVTWNKIAFHYLSEFDIPFERYFDRRRFQQRVDDWIRFISLCLSVVSGEDASAECETLHVCDVDNRGSLCCRF